MDKKSLDTNEQELLLLLRKGDNEAFTVLYKKHWRQVYNFCRLYLSTKEDAEEILQEVFIKLWEMHALIRVEDKLEGLLFIITRNIIFNENRRKLNENYYKVSMLAAMEESISIEEEIETQNIIEYIDQLIAKLPPLRQQVFNLNRKEGKTYKEIAQELNISEKAVEHQLTKAMRYLKKNFTWIMFLLCGT